MQLGSRTAYAREKGRAALCGPPSHAAGGDIGGKIWPSAEYLASWGVRGSGLFSSFREFDSLRDHRITTRTTLMMTIEMTKVKKRVDGAAVGGKAHYLASKNGDLFQVSAAHERWDGTVP